MSAGIGEQSNYHRIRKARLHTARVFWDVSVTTDAHLPTPNGQAIAVAGLRFVYTAAGDGGGDPVNILIGTYLAADGTTVDADSIVAGTNGQWSDLAAATVVGSVTNLTLASTITAAAAEGKPRVLATQRVRATAAASGANISEGFIEMDYWIIDDVDVETPES